MARTLQVSQGEAARGRQRRTAEDRGEDKDRLAGGVVKGKKELGKGKMLWDIQGRERGQSS